MPATTDKQRPCKICGHATTLCFSASILQRHTAHYYQCDHCGFVQVDSPAWLDEAYRETITRQDTMILDRNIRVRRNLLVVLFYLFSVTKTHQFLDFAGGTGLLVRLMRDVGCDFYWHDLHTANLFARGFEAEPTARFHATTCIEALEHFVSPLDELTRMFSRSDTLLCTTCLLPEDLTPDWSYLGRQHGQHIAFYSKKTFAYLASHFNAHYYELRGLHILTRHPVSARRLTFLRLACRSRAIFVALYANACWRLGSLAYTDALKISESASAKTPNTVDEAVS